MNEGQGHLLLGILIAILGSIFAGWIMSLWDSHIRRLSRIERRQKILLEAVKWICDQSPIAQLPTHVQQSIDEAITNGEHK